VTKFILTILDTGGIQDYIFGSNKLQLNLAASYLVDAATRAWVKESLDAIEVKHNLDNVKGFDAEQPFLPGLEIESSAIDAEVILAGGGNTQILFRDLATAKRFAQKLSRKVLDQSTGLKITIIHEKFDWEKDMLGGEPGVIDRTMKRLAQRKMQSNTSPPILGLGVTAQDIYTGLPVVSMHEGLGVSAEIKAKYNVVDDANRRLASLLNMSHGYQFAWQFEDMGQKEGESNYIAVIHADGNGMGNRVRAVGRGASDNRDYVTKMRAFSLSIRKAALTTLQETVDKLVEIIEDEGIREEIKMNGRFLPFRPIVFGGDDITFVAEGRLGLTLTAFYLKKFSEKTYTDNKPAYARAGIAVVKSHFPFARAYRLAEALASSAKRRIKEVSPDGEAVAMDWHFASLGPILSLNEIREREYTAANGASLLMRPVLLSESVDWRTWDNMVALVKEFKENDNWRERHNKVMRLRSALRQGPQTVDHFRKVYNVGLLPPIAGLGEEVRKTGWENGYCGYFDAIETKDFFIPLERMLEVQHA